MHAPRRTARPPWRGPDHKQGKPQGGLHSLNSLPLAIPLSHLPYPFLTFHNRNQVRSGFVASRRKPEAAAGVGSCVIVPNEANRTAPLRGDQFSAMAKRRFQNPKPFREDNWWWLIIWTDELHEGRLRRKRKRVKLCSADTAEREARKIAS
jgi:hypothetical protein